MSIRVDEDYHPTEVRREGAVIGELNIPASTAANTWTRLMPNGNNGAKVAGASNQINIGAIRADLFPRQIIGWRFKVLSEGYLQENQIDSIEMSGTDVILNFLRPLHWHDSLPTTGIEWVIFPLVDFKFGIGVLQSAPNNQELQLGVTADEAYSPDIKQFYRMQRENYQTHLHIRTAQVDKIFYRFAVETSGVNVLVWGEYEAQRI